MVRLTTISRRYYIGATEWLAPKKEFVVNSNSDLQYSSNDTSIRRISMREFRRDISKELSEIFQKHTRLIITRNNEDRACVIPMQLMAAIQEIVGSIDMNQLMAGTSQYGLSDELRNHFVDQILMETYPSEQHPRDLASATELWMSGTNLRRAIPHRFKELKQVLERGGAINAIFANPGSAEMMRYAAMQEQGNVKGEEVRNTQIELIKQNMEHLLDLSKEVSRGKVSMYKTDYPMGFGLDVINPNSEEGIIYVRYFPFADDGRPVLRLTRKNDRWYRFYFYQFQRLKTAIKQCVP
jgi:hypothetical protein